MSKIITEVMTITPDSARRILEKNNGNRPINNAYVNYYDNQMVRGLWTLTGQTISFGEDNRLLDGQHRLAAVIKANIPIQFNVARNVPNSTFVNYDNGKPRTAVDSFKISDIKHASRTTSLINKYIAYKKGLLFQCGFSEKSGKGFLKKTDTLTNIEMLKFFNDNKQLIYDIIRLSEALTYRVKLFNQTQISVLMFYLIVDKNHSQSKVFNFFSQLFTNDGVTNSSIYVLREKLIQGSIGNTILKNSVKYLFLVKCWNAYIQNKQIIVYRAYENEPTPELL